MAFIDWLKKQHADSLRASQRMAADPFLKGMQPGANTAPAPAGAIPFQRTKPGFFARDYKKEDLVKKVMIEKNDGTKEIKSEWEEPRFPVHQGNVRATALPDSGARLSGIPVVNTTPPQRGFPNRVGMGGFTGGASMYDMARDPGWAGVPRARAAPQPRRVQPRSPISPEAQAAIAQVQATGGQNVDASGRPISVSSIANIGMPQVADLRNRIAAIDRQQAAIPRQQMPPPRHVPPVDWRNFPSVQDRNTGTYTLPPPQVELNRGGFSLPRALKNIPGDYTNWWDQNVRRQAVGDTSTIGGKIPQAFWDFYEENPTIHQAARAGVKSGIWDPIKERMDKILEDIRKRREGQTMAPFDWRNN